MILISFLFSYLNASQTICTLQDLKPALIKDFLENDMVLTCDLQYWKNDCGFQTSGESLNHWQDALEKNYKITKIYNQAGQKVEPQEKQLLLKNQAHMCIIMRSIIFNYINSKNLQTKKQKEDQIKKSIEKLECPTNSEEVLENQPESNKICAVNSFSFSKTEQWYILLDGQNLQLNKKPTYKQTL